MGVTTTTQYKVVVRAVRVYVEDTGKYERQDEQELINVSMDKLDIQALLKFLCTAKSAQLARKAET